MTLDEMFLALNKEFTKLEKAISRMESAALELKEESSRKLLIEKTGV